MAANKRLNATITIGGVISGAFKSAMSDTKSRIVEVGSAIRSLEKEQRLMSNGISTFGRMGKNVDGLRHNYAQAGDALKSMRHELERLKAYENMKIKVMDKRGQYQSGLIGSAATAVAIGATVKAPLDAFKELDAAMNNMQVAMTNSAGQVPKQFEEIKKQTIELGNVLPGTTADFVNVATALKEQGVSVEMIAGGALKAASHLGVIMKMPPEQAAEMVAKLKEAYQLNEHEFDKMADYTQKAKFGFGVNADDLVESAKYVGATMGTLGMTGVDNAKKILALQGMAMQAGLTGEKFGTGTRGMFSKIAMLKDTLGKGSKEMKEVNAELAKAHIHFQFFDKKGQFVGLDKFIEQIGQLDKLNPEQRMKILYRLFGEENKDMADLLARKGVAGYKQALSVMDVEASLEQRIKIATGSFQNTLEALSGTITNFLAEVGKPMAEALSPVLVKMNEIVGGPMQKWVSDNKEIIKDIGLIIAAGTGLAVVGAAINAIGLASTFAMGGLLKLAGVLGGVSAVLGVIGAAIAAAPALAAAVVAGLVAGAVLVYENWDKVGKLWEWLTDKIEALGATIKWLWDRTKEGTKSLNESIGGGIGGFSDWVQAHQWNKKDSLPAVQMRGTAPTQVINNTPSYSFIVNPTPNQSPKDIAQEVHRIIKREQGVQQRSSMYDFVTGH